MVLSQLMYQCFCNINISYVRAIIRQNYNTNRSLSLFIRSPLLIILYCEEQHYGIDSYFEERQISKRVNFSLQTNVCNGSGGQVIFDNFTTETNFSGLIQKKGCEL